MRDWRGHQVTTFRYGDFNRPEPKGWTKRPMLGHHGESGYCILEKKAMTNGRAKGHNFERQLCRMIEDELGFEVHRDLMQYAQKDRGDIIGVPGWTIEAKRYSADRGTGGNYKPEWWSQVCESSALAGCEPVLIYKYDRQPIKCVVFLSSINPAYMEKDNTATVTFETWCMLVRESLV